MDNRESKLIAREQEQSVLGALLQDNNAVDRIGDLKPEHFYDATHKQIFQSILKLVMANKPADAITVFDHLQAHGNDADLIYLNQLTQSMPGSANIARYAAIVRDRAIKRGLIAQCQGMVDQVLESAEDSSVLVDRLTSELEKLSQATTSDEPVLARDDLVRHIEQIDARFHGANTAAVSTGLTDLDSKLNGGLRPGNLVVLAARPKMGKTALALNIANNVAQDGVALVLSMEMTRSELHDRNLASLGLIQLDHLLEPKKMEDSDWPRITSAVQKIDSMRLYLHEQAGLTLMHVRNKAKQVKRKAKRLDLIVIDYLQLMNGEGDNRNAQIEVITRGLKNLAKELNCPIILLSQLNRKLEDRPNKRPQPADLRDSGSIEQDADVAIFLYRDEVYNEDSEFKGICEANVALNRQGSAGVVNLVYRGQYTKFEDVSKDWRPPERRKVERRRGFSAD